MLIVGDSLTSDIRGGNAVGIDTCWFNPHGSSNTAGVHLEYEIRSLKAEDRANKDSMRTLNRNSRASLQKVGIVKYNAFKGMGGNLSSVVALLDYTNSGFILNCVHSREGCYIYVKVVDMGQTEIVLGNEEQEALEQAMGYIKRG